MRRMTATEASRNFSELLNRIAGGERVEITRSGAVIAVIGPPHPCVTVQWWITATRSVSGGAATLTSDSIGLCLAADNAPQGIVVVQVTQTRARGLLVRTIG